MVSFDVAFHARSGTANPHDLYFSVNLTPANGAGIFVLVAAAAARFRVVLRECNAAPCGNIGVERREPFSLSPNDARPLRTLYVSSPKASARGLLLPNLYSVETFSCALLFAENHPRPLEGSLGADVTEILTTARQRA